MEFIQLLSFHEIVRTGSFSKASARVFRSQSAVSHQIKKLETELGVRLFERLGKTVRLTDEGRILFDVVSEFLTKLENVESIYSDTRKGAYGKLSIVTSSAMITYVLPKVTNEFLASFQKVRFKLITPTVTLDIPRIVMNGHVDFGIGPRMEVDRSMRLIFLPWKSFGKVLIMENNHPLSRKQKISLGDIARYPLILYKEGMLIRKIVDEAFKKTGISCEIVMEMDVADNIKKYVEMGIGISIVSSLTVTEKDKANLSLVDVSHLLGQTDYGIYLRSDKYITRSMVEFIRIFSPQLVERLPNYGATSPSP